MCIYLAPTSITYSAPRPRCSCVVWASATNATAWLRNRTDYCAFLLKRCEPHGVPSSCGRSCMACAIVSKSYAIVFRNNRRFNYRPQFQSRQSPHHIFHVRRRHYRPRIKSWKLPGRQWESNPQPSEQLRLMMIKTSASTETATEAWQVMTTLAYYSGTACRGHLPIIIYVRGVRDGIGWLDASI